MGWVHFGWWDGDGGSGVAGGGKALRPALVIGCARAVGGHAELAVAAAVAVELVHNFSLLHDDVWTLTRPDAIGPPYGRCSGSPQRS